jgi:hypothetical protein
MIYNYNKSIIIINHNYTPELVRSMPHAQHDIIIIIIVTVTVTKKLFSIYKI